MCTTNIVSLKVSFIVFFLFHLNNFYEMEKSVSACHGGFPIQVACPAYELLQCIRLQWEGFIYITTAIFLHGHLLQGLGQTAKDINQRYLFHIMILFLVNNILYFEYYIIVNVDLCLE